MAEAVAGMVGSVAGEEAKSAIATLLGQILAIIRTLIDWALRMFRRVIEFAGTHPEALIQVVGLTAIWVA